MNNTTTLQIKADHVMTTMLAADNRSATNSLSDPHPAFLLLPA